MHHALTECRRSAAGFYTLFSRLLHREMDEELWRLLEANAHVLPAFGGEKSAAPALREMVARHAAEGKEEALLTLASLYAKAFLGMREGGGVPLCQSVYTSPKHLLFQQPIFDARAAYRSEQLELPEGGDMPDDHLAVILAFLSHQAALAADLPPEVEEWIPALEKEARFRQKLALSWVKEAATLAETRMPDSFYTLLLRYLEEFLEYDQMESDALLADLKALSPTRTMAAGA